MVSSHTAVFNDEETGWTVDMVVKQAQRPSMPRGPTLSSGPRIELHIVFVLHGLASPEYKIFHNNG